MNYRNRELLDLSADQTCQFQIPGVCLGGPCVTCHSNESEHGKGVSIKAHDCFSAWGCYACHVFYDTGPASRAEKQAVFRVAMERTILAMWRQGLVGIIRRAVVRDPTTFKGKTKRAIGISTARPSKVFPHPGYRR